MDVVKVNELLGEMTEALGSKDRRLLKPSEVTVRPYKKSSIGDMHSVQYMGKTVGTVTDTKGGWQGSSLAGLTKKFPGKNGKEQALKALIKKSPYGVVRKDGTPVD